MVKKVVKGEIHTVTYSDIYKSCIKCNYKVKPYNDMLLLSAASVGESVNSGLDYWNTGLDWNAEMTLT